jgi:hypothetical protein
MDGLKIFVDQGLSEPEQGFQVFYSRRADGPYYRWAYEEAPKRWRVSRVLSSDFSPKNLALSPWKSVPAPLQKKVIDHYQD